MKEQHKRTRSMKQKISLYLVFAMIFQIVFFSPFNVSEEWGSSIDVTESIPQNAEVILSQDDIPIPDGGTIIAGKDLTVQVRFDVPVLGDWGDPLDPGYVAPDDNAYIQKGDEVEFDFSTFFKFKNSHVLNMYTEGSMYRKVGEVQFTENTSIAKVVFNGDEVLFDGNYHSVNCNFTATLAFDDSGIGDPGDDNFITILGKTFELKRPEKGKVYQLNKTGTADLSDKSITWKVEIQGENLDTENTLYGFYFEDDLSDVGEYIEGTFKVGGEIVVPVYSENVLSYTFTATDKTLTTVVFKTRIPDSQLYANKTTQNVTNIATMKDSDSKEIVAQGSGEVKFMPQWISKSGVEEIKFGQPGFDNNDRRIRWTVAINPYGVEMREAVVKERLPIGATFISAELFQYDNANKKWDPVLADNGLNWFDISNGMLTDTTVRNIFLTLPTPTSEYYKISIVTKLPEKDYISQVETIRNYVTLDWKDSEGKGNSIFTSGGVGVGYNAIKKTGEIQIEGIPSIDWTVEVNPREQEIPDLKVLDLFVHAAGINQFDRDTLQLPSATGLSEELWPQTVKYLYPTCRQRLLYDNEGNVMNVNVISGNVKVKSFKLTDVNGKYVADLLIADLSDNEPETICKFSFKTQLTIVYDYSLNDTNEPTELDNNVELFSANAKINESMATVSFTSKMLEKASMALEQDIPEGALANGDWTNNYDYLDNSAVFRIDVNKNKVNFHEVTDVNGNYAGDISLVDELPLHWTVKSFVDGAPESYFRIFEVGDGGYTEILDFNTVLEGGKPVVTPGTNTDREIVTFTFKDFSKNYVIFLKAGPTAGTLEEFFAKNDSITVQNVANLKFSEWPGVIVRDTENVVMISDILNKSMRLADGKPGMIEWEIDYKPNIVGVGSKLVDVLPDGVEIRTDSTGKVLLTENGEALISAYEIILKSDGSFADHGDAIPLTVGENITYNNTTRELTFVFPDKNKGYRLIVKTDITGEPGDTISNVVKLYGDTEQESDTSDVYTVTKADAAATAKQNGLIRLIKKAADGTTLLSGAEFVLTAADGKTIIRRGRTDANGILTFRGIPVGAYILTETLPPQGYALQQITYKVTVEASGDSVVTKIDDKTYQDGFTVINYPAESVGNLKISKTVDGNQADTNKAFSFSVYLYESNAANSAELSETYEYTGFGVPKGTIKSGDTVELKHGEYITIIGLPKGAGYKIQEIQQTDGEYRVSVSDSSNNTIYSDTANGTITEVSLSEANFLNYKNITVPQGPDGPGPGTPSPSDKIPPLDPENPSGGGDNGNNETPRTTDPSDQSSVTDERPGEDLFDDDIPTAVPNFPDSDAEDLIGTEDGQEFENVGDDDVPLGGLNLPKTGDHSPYLLIILICLAVITSVYFLLPRKLRETKN